MKDEFRIFDDEWACDIEEKLNDLHNKGYEVEICKFICASYQYGRYTAVVKIRKQDSR